MSGRADDPPAAGTEEERSLRQPLLERGGGESIQGGHSARNGERGPLASTSPRDGQDIFPKVATLDSVDHEDRVERFLWPTATAGGSDQHLQQHTTPRRLSWQFPGWGGIVQDMNFQDNELEVNRSMCSSYRAYIDKEAQHEPNVQLGELPATAICGCDIMASVLYTTGLVASRAGKLAPICMMVVAFVLYLFRFIYSEAVCSLPLNGGSYNVLLNATTKGMAAVCACLSILSYLATGVVSAISATSYLQSVWPSLDVPGAAIGLLFLFALLVFIGMTESAGVASCIFLAHMLTLCILVVTGVAYAISNTTQFVDNINAPFPEIDIAFAQQQGTVITALFYGYSSAMLGVTGFETSANFVEEQAPGVFANTLRNMWWCVTVFNPLLVLLALFCFDVDYMKDHQPSLMADMGQKIGDWMGTVTPTSTVTWGDVLRYVVAIDAFVVLSGSVLTSYVGMGGLLKRLAMDRCFPAMVLARNKWRGTHHVIIFGFFLVAMSLILILDGSVEALAGVYTMAFLSVMSFFAIGTMLLKFKRPDLRRTIICPWWMATAGLVFVFIAFIGNVMDNAETLPYFVLYYTLILALCVAMFQRVRVLKLLVLSCRGSGQSPPNRIVRYLVDTIRSIQEEPFLFLAKTSDPSVINKALLYVRDNEQTSRVLVVHFYEDEDVEGEARMRDEFKASVQILDKIYPKIMVNCLLVKGHFGPDAIDRLSYETRIPHNRMFLACPNVIHNLHEFGGVRIITH